MQQNHFTERHATPLSFKERAGVRMGLYSGFLIPIPTLILPLKGRKLVFDRGSIDACCITYADVNNANELNIVTSLGGIPLTLPSPAEGRG
jgi:hypothetical protein